MKHKGVEGGTTGGAKSLCKSCRHAHVTKGLAESSETVTCHAFSTRVMPPIITECNQYDDKSQTSLWDMKAIAWVLVNDKKTGKIGFMNAKDYKNLRQNEDDILPGVER
jgi:hypothetical protein